MATKTKKTVKLERTTPESVGVSSKAILGFIKDMEDRGLENHSFMILRHGKVLAEGWRSPYNPDTPHALYSFSKSFSSLAIGYAIDEGVIVPKTGKPLGYETKVIDIFPNSKQEFNKYDNLLTLRNLLRMRSGKKMNLLTDKSKVDWIEDFMNAPYDSEPGSKWKYCNENSYMLCAIIRELTGQTVVEWLTPRFFEPMGIDVPFWETDQTGTESGGWGLYLKTEDLAKFCLCLLNGGEFEGQQIMPADWVDKATKFQGDNKGEVNSDSQFGYGYQFWMNGPGKGYRADGMFSQFGIVLPEYDAVVVVTGAVPVEQDMRDCIWNTFPSCFKDEPLPEDKENYKKLQDVCKNLSLPKYGKSKRMKRTEARYSGKTFKMMREPVGNTIGFPSSMLALPITFMGIVKGGNIDNLRFDFKEKEVQVSWTEDGGKEMSVPVGLDGEYRYGRMDNLGPAPFTSCSIGQWVIEDGTAHLDISIRPLEAIAERHFSVTFGDDRIVVKMGETPDIAAIGASLKVSLGVILGEGIALKGFEGLLGVAPTVLDPTLAGKVVD